MGTRRWGLLRVAVYLGATGAPGGGAVALAVCCRLRWATGCLSGCRAVRGAHAHEVPGAIHAVVACPPGTCGGLGARYVIVSGDGLRRSPCYHAIVSTGRSAHAAVLAFGLGAGRVA